MDYSPVLTPQLILITDSVRFTQAVLFERIEAALAGGVDTLLVREKQLDSAKVLALASEYRALTRQYQARLIIHSFADIALAVEADGVHLASDQLQHATSLRTWLGETDMSISGSCHHQQDLLKAAQQRLDFVLLSPVFATQSHPEKSSLGADKFKQLAATSAIPVIALGGITCENRQQLASYGVAVMTGLLDSKKPEKVALSLSASKVTK